MVSEDTSTYYSWFSIVLSITDFIVEQPLMNKIMFSLFLYEK